MIHWLHLQGEYYFYGKKVQDASQGWFPVPCLEASEGVPGMSLLRHVIAA
jgi:hypothetical protein